MVLEARAVRLLLPLLRHVVPLNDENWRLKMPVGKGRCARDALPHTFDIGVFKTIKNNSTMIKHIYNQSENIIEGHKVSRLLLPPMIARISYEQCRLLARRVWWHALAFVTHQVTWHPTYVV